MSNRDKLTAWFAALLLSFSAWAADTKTVDGIVAVVNNGVILQSELAARANQLLQRLEAERVDVPPRDVLLRQILERLILEKIQLQLAELNGVTVDDETMRRAVERIAQQNNLSVEALRAAVEREGVGFAEFTQQLRNEVMIGRLRSAQVNSQVRVTDREVDAYMKKHGILDTNAEYLVGHILVATPEAASPSQIDSARKNAEKIMEQLKAGADFQKTAVGASNSAQALEGGSLGWRKLADLPVRFADTVTTLQKGDLAGPIQSASGFHIIKLLDRRGGTRTTQTEQTHVRHILVRTSELVSDALAQQRLNEYKNRIQQGEPFEQLARSFSEDRASAVKGGDLGWVDHGALVPQFEDAMRELAIDELSTPVQTQFGWHLIQVLGRRDRDDGGRFERDQAKDALFKRKVEEETELWLRRIRDEAYVEIRLPGVAEGAR